MARFFYHNLIPVFLADTNDAILGALARNNAFDLTELQRNAWLFEISCLKQLLQDESEGQIISLSDFSAHSCFLFIHKPGFPGTLSKEE